MIWQACKGGTSGGGLRSLAGDKRSWDSAAVFSQGKGGSDSNNYYVECFALYEPFDGLLPKDETKGTHHYTTFYSTGALDEHIQNDGYCPIVCTDFLMDGGHTFISTRRGNSSDEESSFPMTFKNGLIKMGRFPPYYGGWGGGFDASWNPGALFTGPYINGSSPANRGLPNVNNGQYGYGHSEVWKDGDGHNGPVIMTDCIIYDQGMSLGGKNELSLPEKSGSKYTNVLYLFVGETTPDGQQVAGRCDAGHRSRRL